MWSLVLIGSVIGCGGALELDMSPSSLDLGTIDFDEEMPEEGFNPQPVTVRNVSDVDTVLSVIDDDPDRLCVQGFPEPQVPYELGTLPAGASYTLQVAACGYLPGERDSSVVTGLTLGADGAAAPLDLSVTFVPTRTIEDGTE